MSKTLWYQNTWGGLSATTDRDVARSVVLLQAQAATLDDYRARINAARGRGVSGEAVDHASRKLGEVTQQWIEANGYAKDAYRAAQRDGAIDEHGGINGIGSLQTLALGVGTAVALVVAVFFAASLGPFVLAAAAIVAGILALSTLVSALDDLAETVLPAGSSAPAAFGLGAIVALGAALWFMAKRKRGAA